jgi:ComF family protein
MSSASKCSRWTEPGREALRALGLLLFPVACKICGQVFVAEGGGPACPACWAKIAPWAGSLCRRCGRPLAAQPARRGARCGDCRQPRPFQRARSYGMYAAELRELLQLFKFGGAEGIGMRLGSALGELLRCEPEYAGAELVTWVPLHWRRRRARGFDQAQLLAREVARKLGLAPARGALRRVRDTAPQSGLGGAERRRNLRNAFAARRWRLRGARRLILVDDVWTTGSTLAECARTLRRAGARRVYLATVARVL